MVGNAHGQDGLEPKVSTDSYGEERADHVQPMIRHITGSATAFRASLSS